jgi:hypothetical protein
MSETTNAILRYQTNVPEIIQPRFFRGAPDIEIVEGQYGQQAKLKLADGRITYLPTHIGDQITAMQLQPGERIEICKREIQDGLKRKVRWDVIRIEDEPAAPVPAAAAGPVSQASPAAAVVQSPQVATQVNKKATHGQTESTILRPRISYGEAIQAALIGAIDAAHAAEAHAASVGRPIQFSSADIQGIASTLFIQASRDGLISFVPVSTQPAARINGGTH